MALYIVGDNTVTSAKIKDGEIVNADLNAGAAVVDSKLATITTANKVGLAALDIDGGTDIGAALADADLIIVDDGAGGANRKATMSRLATYTTAKTIATANTWTAAQTHSAAITVGVDDTGYDVKFFGDTAGVYALWDTSENKFKIRGPAGTGVAAAGTLRLETAETTIVDGDVLGMIEFMPF